MSYRNYGPCNGAIINPRNNGDFASFPLAMASAGATWNTIYYVNESGASYTGQDFTMPPGVLLTSMPGSGQLGNIQVNTQITINQAGNYVISNLELVSSTTYSIVISGSGAVNVVLDECYFNMFGFTAINFSNTNSASTLIIKNCRGNYATTGVALWTSSSPGFIGCVYTDIANTANSITPTNNSAGLANIEYCDFRGPLSTSGTGGMGIYFSIINSTASPTIPLTFNGINSSNLFQVLVQGATFPCISIGAGVTLLSDEVNLISLNQFAIIGAGNIEYGLITMQQSTGISIGAAIAETTRTGYLLPLSIEMATGTTLQIDGGATVQVRSGAVLNLQAGASIDVPLSGLLIGQGANTPVIASSITNHALLVGGASQTIGYIADVATGQVLVSGGTSANPAFSAYPQISGLGIGASAGSTAGITFDGSNWMNAYSVGTWTPTMLGTVPGATTYTAQNGYYIRIGSLVQVQCIVTSSASTGTGNLQFPNLPFTIKNQTNGGVYGSVSIVNAVTFPVGATYLLINGIINTTVAEIAGSGTGTGVAFLQMANISYNNQWTLVHEI